MAAKKKATKKVTKAAPAKKVTAKKATVKKATTKKATPVKKVTEKKVSKKAVAKKTTKRTPNKAFMKPLTPSAELAQIVGDKPLPRTDVVKKIWDYIKEHNLQDAKVKRNINADAALLKVFGKKTVSMFEMAKIISSHLK